jgi:drug/metabolite transporter (DMT)-like permease
MTAAQWALLFTLSMLWGGSFAFNDVALRDFAPLSLVALRVTLGAALLLGVARASGRRMPRGLRAWRSLATMGLVNNALPFSLFAWGQTHIGAGLASILNATTPIWVVIVAHLATRDERATPLRVAGVVAGFAGVAVAIGAAAPGGDGWTLVAELACVVATLAYASAGVYGRRLAGMGVGAMEAAGGQLACAALVLVPLALAIDTPWRSPPPGAIAWATVAGLAALSTALAFVIYFRLLATAGATNLLAVTFLIPVTAVALSTVVLGETLARRHVAGFALIALGLTLIDGRAWRWRVASSRPI